MEEESHNSERQEAAANHPWVTRLLAVVVVAAIGTSLWFLLKSPPAANPTVQAVVAPKAGDTEQAYAKSLRVENIAMSRAENFLHQEVTILNAEIVNDGAQAVQAVDVTVEFSDDMNQVVLREARRVFGAPEAKLTPAERRAFEISFDHVPPSWNLRAPAVRVANLQLAKAK
jgi:hypothetical protein